MTLRVVTLERNRGKGGAVTHGMRHVRGKYVLFADADGASKFSDVAKLLRACRAVADERGRAVAIGSRAHLVGSEAVVKVRCFVLEISFLSLQPHLGRNEKIGESQKKKRSQLCYPLVSIRLSNWDHVEGSIFIFSLSFLPLM